MMTSTRKKAGGFTLIELMVSMAVFGVVMLIATGVLLVMIGVNARAQALYGSYNNLAFAMDAMTREIRTSKSITSCGVNGIAFTRGWKENAGAAESVAYAVSGDRITQDGMAITAEEVHVDSLQFVCDGTGVSTSTGKSLLKQPVVTVTIEGYFQQYGDETTPFKMKSRIVPRLLER